MPRRNFADGMEITYNDLSAINTEHEKELYDRMLFEVLQQFTAGVFGGAFAVTRVSATQLQVAGGNGLFQDTSQASPEPAMRPLFLATAQTANIAAPDATNPRIDLICLVPGRANTVTASRKYKDAITGVISNQTLTVETDWLPTIQVVTGTPAGSPAVPATPAGYMKLAEVAVTAVSGIAASGAITDRRVQLPVGQYAVFDTVGFNKLTAGTAVQMKQLLSDIDAGLASGGGGGGGMRWQAQTVDAAVSDFENGEQIFLFPNATPAKATVMFQIPSGYVAGKQISVLLTCYTPDSTNNLKMKTTTTLIRQNTDAMDSVTNQHASTNAQLTNTVAKAPRRITFDLTDASGLVNTVAVAAGDILKIELTRDYAGETTPGASDVRFLPSATEPKLS